MGIDLWVFPCGQSASARAYQSRNGEGLQAQAHQLRDGWAQEGVQPGLQGEEENDPDYRPAQRPDATPPTRKSRPGQVRACRLGLLGDYHLPGCRLGSGSYLTEVDTGRDPATVSRCGIPALLMITRSGMHLLPTHDFLAHRVVDGDKHIRRMWHLVPYQCLPAARVGAWRTEDEFALLRLGSFRHT